MEFRPSNKYVLKCSTRVCSWPDICGSLEFRSLDLKDRIGSLFCTISPMRESIVSVRSQGSVIFRKSCSLLSILLQIGCTLKNQGEPRPGWTVHS